MSAQTAGGPEAWRRTEAGGAMKKILKRWLILACLGAAVWGGYLLWPALVTGPLPVVRLPDDPYLSGLKVGTGMRAAVRELAYDYYERGLARQGGPGEKLVARAVERAKASAPQNVAQEIRGLADGTGVPERLIWEANIAVDLYCHSSLMACSALVEPKQGGGFLVGRNLDFLDFGVLHRHTVLLVRPRGKSGWTASLAWPGMVGIITGWNDRGEFCSLNLGLNDAGSCRDKNAMPALFMVRKVLESGDPRSEKLAWLKAQPVSFPMILCYADKHGGAIVEKGAQGSRERLRPDGAAFADNDMICWGAPMGDRCALMASSAKEERDGSTVSEVEQTLKRVTLGSVFFKSYCTLYSIVFDPGTGEAWVAEGLLPATRGPYRKVAVLKPAP